MNLGHDLRVVRWSWCWAPNSVGILLEILSHSPPSTPPPVHALSQINKVFMGHLGGLVGWASTVSSGHDPRVPGFLDQAPIWAPRSARSLVLPLTFPALVLSLSLKRINKIF